MRSLRSAFHSIDAVDVLRLRRYDGFAGTIVCQRGSVTSLITDELDLLWLRVSVAFSFERSDEVLWDDGFIRTTIHNNI